jgi:hypothetical protein
MLVLSLEATFFSDKATTHIHRDRLSSGNQPFFLTKKDIKATTNKGKPMDVPGHALTCLACKVKAVDMFT